MLKGVVESQLATQDLKKARSALGQFNMTLDDSILEYARPISLDDIPHVEVCRYPSVTLKVSHTETISRPWQPSLPIM